MRWGAPILIVLALGACSREARQLGPTPPQTRPDGDADARIPAFQDNLFQVAQGGRYFGWYGCSGCHAEGAAGVLDLADGQWQRGEGFSRLFGAIADGHGRLAYGRRVPVEQLWQITAYVRDLPQHHPEKRRRLTVDQQGEPQGSRWDGPL